MAVVEMPPFYRGDDYLLRITVRNQANDEPVDTGGWHCVSTMKLASEMPDSEGIQAVYDCAVEPMENMKGVIMLAFPKEQTDNLIPTKYVMDLQTDMGETRQTLFIATVEVMADVTRNGK